MKTIEPNSEEDLVNQYTAVNVEYVELQRQVRGGGMNCDTMILVSTYQNLIRFLEKNIKERRLYN